MPSLFNKQRTHTPKRSAFDLSREQKLSATFGKLIPTYLEEIIPGDQFRVKSEIMMRLAPMIAPVMHRVNVYMHYFFIPNRLIWNEWEDFITGGREGNASPVYPVMDYNDAVGGLADYLGLPTETDNNELEVSQLPFRAYQLIWNEYYRDPNLVEEIDIHSMTPGQLEDIQYRCWEKDYFTSALPWPQRGPEVGLPIDFQYSENSQVVDSEFGNPAPFDRTLGTMIDAGQDPGGLSITDGVGGGNTIRARLENLEEEGISVTINELRESNALQRWLEKSAQGGYRYIETILSHFGIKSSDARLQRPEYLGGGKQPVVISEVLNTTGTEDAPQGTMAGHGISADATNSFQSQFEEHGYVMGIMSILPRTAYQQGVMRHWSRRDKTDYYWPEFAHLGEQEVKLQELYVDNNTPLEETFGYQQRYAEMKYGCSTVHGEFRDTLNFWHIGRIFQTEPQLNHNFTRYPSSNTPHRRIFAVDPETGGGDPLWIQIFHNVKARRPMPYFADPKL